MPRTLLKPFEGNSDFKIQVWNRQQAENLVSTDVIISINGVGAGEPVRASLRDTWRDVLFLEFDDADDEDQKRILWQREAGQDVKPLTLFTHAQAELILEFVKKHQAVKNIHVHCLAGVSRSVAVGLCIAERFGRELHLNSPHGQTIEGANTRVCRVFNRLRWEVNEDA